MYEHFYGFEERPFSITPDPRFVFLSQRHQDALAHLLYGVGRGGSGGFVQLTGEVGTGKTTLCRLMLEQVPEHTRIALILNPMLEPRELLRAICRELEVPVADDAGLETLGQALNQRLLEIHAAGERAVLIIDEAQNMSRETLEQVRLLTNLETSTDKLLQIILLGQPELRELLARESLRQLAQRITARYHLDPLAADETVRYVRHRIEVAGAPRCPFTPQALRALHRVSGGVPRLINIIADRALMAGYARELERISPALVRRAAAEVVVGDDSNQKRRWTAALAAAALAAVVVVAGGMVYSLSRVAERPDEPSLKPLWQQALDRSDHQFNWREVAQLLDGVDGDSVRDACTGEPVEGLVCLRMRGSSALLARIDRPAVLSLDPPHDGRILVLRVAAGHARIRQLGQEFEVPLTALDQRWFGEFQLPWRDSGRVWQRGDQDSSVRQLKALAAADSVRPWTGSVDSAYDDAFSDWVRGFQRRHGLREDGMAGPETRLFMQIFLAPTAESPGN